MNSETMWERLTSRMLKLADGVVLFAIVMSVVAVLLINALLSFIKDAIRVKHEDIDR